MRRILEDLRRNSRVVNNGLSYDPTTLIDKPELDLLLSEEDKAFSNLQAENARLRKAGDGLLRAVVGMRTGSLRPFDFPDSAEIVDNYIREWREVRGETT